MSTVLQFSGGKDSLACLYLYQEWWGDPDFYVMWCNTGAAYPETLALMDKWRNTVRNFIEVKTDQQVNIEHYGLPADIVPMRNTFVARQFGSARPTLIQAGFACCSSNIWSPMALAVKEICASVVVRGQRDDDALRGPVTDGQVIDGVTFRLPLQKWTGIQVFKYLEEVGAEIPPYYAKHEMTGRDCWSCTAYLWENEVRIARLPAAKRMEVKRRLGLIQEAVQSESRHDKIIKDIGYIRLVNNG